MNINSTVLDPFGREVYALGGETAWKVHTHKGYVVSLEWFVGNRTTEPMMLIWPESALRQGGAWGICLSSAGKFAEPEGGPTAECFTEAKDVLEDLFDRPALAVEVKTLVDVVMRFMPDLLQMPPAPMAVRRQELGGPVLEVTRKENGKTVQEVEL